MDIIKKISLLLFFAQGVFGYAQTEMRETVYTGRFLDGKESYALIARSKEPKRWQGDDYFLADLLLVNTRNGKEKVISTQAVYALNAFFTDEKHLLYSDGSRIYSRKVKGWGKPKLVYTVRDTQLMTIMDMVKYENEVYVVVADYSEKILVNPRWPSDDDSYTNLLKGYELETGTEIFRMAFPYMKSPRYRCTQKTNGWVFSVMDTTFVMDAPRHLQPSIPIVIPGMDQDGQGLLFENPYFSVSPGESKKEVAVKKK